MSRRNHIFLKGADITKMIYEIDSQLNRELNEIRRSIEEAEEITERKNREENPYEKNIMDKLSNDYISKGDEESL